MIVRLLTLLLLLTTAPTLVAPAMPCCPQDWDCCAHEMSGAPAPPDDCCSIAPATDYVAVPTPDLQQIAPDALPALSVVVADPAGSRSVAAPSASTALPPRFHLHSILRN